MKRTLFPLLLSMTPALLAQQPALAPADDHQLILQLLNRVQELEAEVKQLKGGAAAVVSSSVPAAPAAAPAGSVQPPTAPAQRSIDTMAMGKMHEMALPGTEGLEFRGFSDANFTDNTAKGAHSTFADGEFNLFMTSKLSDRFSVLGELVFAAGANNRYGVDLERMLFQWTPNDYFRLAAGRYHTSIGYYNTAYHHANWLLTTAERPFLFSFESYGGILPLHNVGLTATGLIPSGGLGLHWIAEVGNGRTSSNENPAVAEPVQNAQDENSRKSYNMALFARPASVEGLQAGFSVYQDRLYPAAGSKIGESIWDGYVTYHPSGFEFTSEALVMRHAIEGSGRVYNIPGFYSLVSKNFGQWRPYFSWEYLNVPVREPVWGAIIGRRSGPSTGIRYDFSDFAAVKLEYYRLMQRGINDINGVRAQVAFTF